MAITSHLIVHLDKRTDKQSFKNTLQKAKLLSKTLLWRDSLSTACRQGEEELPKTSMQVQYLEK